jgi:hypothetical protein
MTASTGYSVQAHILRLRSKKRCAAQDAGIANKHKSGLQFGMYQTAIRNTYAEA